MRFADVAEPEPAADEAVIAVEAFAINRGETFLLEAPRQGWRPGKDIAGRVVQAAAEGVARNQRPNHEPALREQSRIPPWPCKFAA